MEKENKQIYQEQDVLKQKIYFLTYNRIIWLFLGLIVGLITTYIISYFEKIISQNIYLTFFIPIIVYLSDAVGTQSETIYIREIKERKKINFKIYLLKEIGIGFLIGILSGFIMAFFSFLWLKNLNLSLTLFLTMVINLTIAPILAIFIPTLIYKKHFDPALGAGPVATIIQDLISILVYFFIIVSIY